MLRIVSKLSEAFSVPARRGSDILAQYATGYQVILFLVVVGLVSRLTLLSVSLDEVDSANFHNALKYGYDIGSLRPHAPGYPVYIFMGWILNTVVQDPLRSLTLLSALLGSLAVVPFYLLLRELTGNMIALAGSLLLLVNPLHWSFSETALADVPSMFFVMLAAWLAYAGRQNKTAFLFACVVMSLAIGVRQANISLLPLLFFPVGYRILVTKERSWSLPVAGAALFGVTSMAWFLSAVFIGSGGFGEFFDSLSGQWSGAVKVYDVAHLDSPWIPNFFYRLERFFLGYFVTHPWTGGDAKTAASLALAVPWIFGLALFTVGFRFRNAVHIFIALWLLSLLYPIMAIHFLPRYGLPQLPAVIIACIIGYRFLALTLLSHPRRIEVLSLVAIGTVLLMYAIKYQPPVGSFESSPPPIAPYVAVFIGLGVLLILVARWRGRDELASAEEQNGGAGATPAAATPQIYLGVVLAFLLLLVVPYTIKGYSLASIAHRTPSPSHRLVTFARENFDTQQVTSCWDSTTHSMFEALTPEIVPIGFYSIEELYAAYEAGQTILVSDRCVWFEELDDTLGLVEVAQFQGNSPLWSKAPSLRLYVSSAAEEEIR